MSNISVRFVETNRGDTLQSIAHRELGDAADWAQLIWLNDLIPPFITDVESEAGDRVILAGGKIAIPSNGTEISPDDVETFGADVALDRNDYLASADGDFVLSSGFPNLKLALARRIVTEKRTKLFASQYGCWVGALRGERLGASQLALAALYVKSSILEDDRVSEVVSCVATASGDSISVACVIRPIDGKELSFQVVI